MPTTSFSYLPPEQQEAVVAHMSRNYRGTSPQQLYNLLLENDAVADQALAFAGITPPAKGRDAVGRGGVDWAATAGLDRGQGQASGVEAKSNAKNSNASGTSARMPKPRPSSQDTSGASTDTPYENRRTEGMNVPYENRRQEGMNLPAEIQEASQPAEVGPTGLNDPGGVSPLLLSLLGLARSNRTVDPNAAVAPGREALNGEIISPRAMATQGSRASVEGPVIDLQANPRGGLPAVAQEVLPTQMVAPSMDEAMIDEMLRPVMTETGAIPIPSPGQFAQVTDQRPPSPFPSGIRPTGVDIPDPETEARFKGNIARDLIPGGLTYQDILRAIARGAH